MEVDANKFMNLVIDKTSQKMNSLQAQVIVLESQLHLASESNSILATENARLKEEIAKNIKKESKKSEFTN